MRSLTPQEAKILKLLARAVDLFAELPGNERRSDVEMFTFTDHLARAQGLVTARAALTNTVHVQQCKRCHGTGKAWLRAETPEQASANCIHCAGTGTLLLPAPEPTVRPSDA